MLRHLKHIFFALLPLLLLSGCGDETKKPDIASVSANDFAARFKLRELAPDSRGGYGFESGGKILFLYPGLSVATYEGRVFSLLHAPFLAEDGLRIPLGIVGQLPSEIVQGTASPTPPSGGRMAVIIDAGHGGKDDGCNGGGLKEKDITLDIARRIRADMEKKNVPAKLTRDSDVYLTLDQRSQIANASPGAVFLSVHVNANANSQAQGVESYFIADRISDSARGKKAAAQYEIAGLSGSREVQTAANISSKYRRESEALANCIQQELVAASGQTSRGVKQENFAVLRETFFGPAVLIEVGFVSNPRTRQLLASPAYRQTLAEAIAQGVRRYMNGK